MWVMRVVQSFSFSHSAEFFLPSLKQESVRVQEQDCVRECEDCYVRASEIDRQELRVATVSL